MRGENVVLLGEIVRRLSWFVIHFLLEYGYGRLLKKLKLVGVGPENIYRQICIGATNTR